MSEQPADIAAIKALVETQFASLKWSEERDADRAELNNGFLSDALLFPAARPLRSQTPQSFIDRMEGLKDDKTLTSFSERLTGFTCIVAGNVAIAIAGCEMTENNEAQTQDVSAFLFVKDGQEWRIAAQGWDGVSFDQVVRAD